MRVVLLLKSCELQVPILKIWFNELWVPFYELRSNFTSWKFILPNGNKITSSKLLFASCDLLLMSCKFKEIIVRVASCVFHVENLKKLFSELEVAFYELKIQDDKLTSWKFKMIIFTSCKVDLYKLNI